MEVLINPLPTEVLINPLPTEVPVPICINPLPTEVLINPLPTEVPICINPLPTEVPICINPLPTEVLINTLPTEVPINLCPMVLITLPRTELMLFINTLPTEGSSFRTTNTTEFISLCTTEVPINLCPMVLHIMEVFNGPHPTQVSTFSLLTIVSITLCRRLSTEVRLTEVPPNIRPKSTHRRLQLTLPMGKPIPPPNVKALNHRNPRIHNGTPILRQSLLKWLVFFLHSLSLFF
jgi:hypothetical protein